MDATPHVWSMGVWKYLFMVVSCCLTSCLIHTCNAFDTTTIAVVDMKHVRILCRLITWNVNIWNHDLVEVRYTHVRAIKEHCTSTKEVYHMPNIIF